MGTRFLNNPPNSTIEMHLVSNLSLMLEGFLKFYGSLDVETQQHCMMQAWLDRVSSYLREVW